MLSESEKAPFSSYPHFGGSLTSKSPFTLTEINDGSDDQKKETTTKCVNIYAVIKMEDKTYTSEFSVIRVYFLVLISPQIFCNKICISCGRSECISCEIPIHTSPNAHTQILLLMLLFYLKTKRIVILVVSPFYSTATVLCHTLDGLFTFFVVTMK